MSIANLIAQHASAEAASGNWAAVASVLNARSLMGPGNRITGKATIVGLAAAGIDSDRIRSVLESTPSGRGVLGLLDSGQSVDWLDSVTMATLARNTGSGKLTEQDVTALKSLSRRVPVVTAAQCASAWLTGRLESEWATLQNDGGINAAVAAGDRVALKAALAAAIEVL
jgi:hypothetical protein